MAGTRVVKVAVLERDSEEISWTEEINVFKDILQSGGIQIDEINETRIIHLDDDEQFAMPSGIKSLGLSDKRLYTKDGFADDDWWMVQTHCQHTVRDKVRVPRSGQYFIQNKDLKIKSNGAIWLEKGAKLIVSL